MWIVGKKHKLVLIGFEISYKGMLRIISNFLTIIKHLKKKFKPFYVYWIHLNILLILKEHIQLFLHEYINFNIWILNETGKT